MKKNIVLLIAGLLLISGNVWAGQGEGKAFREQVKKERQEHRQQQQQENQAFRQTCRENHRRKRLPR